MSHPVNVTVQVKGGSELSDFSSLTLSQFMFTHHVFALDFSFEALGRALKLKPDQMHQQAHKQLIGKEVSISWNTALPDGKGGIFKFIGIILEASMHTATDLTNYYQVSGYSPTYLLEDGVQNRTFLKQSLADITKKVLANYPGKHLQQEVKPRRSNSLPYVVQYQESNYQFLNRLASRQGEWLYYDGQTFRLGLAPGTPIRFQSDSNQSFALTMRLQPGKTEAAHYSYRTHAPLHAVATSPTGGHPFSQFALAQSDLLFTQPLRLQNDTQLGDQGQLKEALDLSAAKRAGSLVTLDGNSECFSLIPGSLLDVFDAMNSDYGQFRTLSVRHTIDGDGNYSNHFEALPAGLDSPPPYAHTVPSAPTELAEVIDLKDPRHLGRVRVRFQWPVAKPADAESGWLRVSTPYSGDGKGQLFTPEKGSQVLVGHEGGLPEFPVVLGNLFHPKNKQQAKYSTNDNQLKGLQTAGGNKVVMSDKKGEQTILLSNSNNKGTAVEVGFKGDGSITIKSNGPVTVLSPTIKLEAGSKGKISLHGKNITIDAEDSLTLKGGKKIDSTTLDYAVDASNSAKLSGKMSTDVKGATVTVAGDMLVDVKGLMVKINS